MNDISIETSGLKKNYGKTNVPVLKGIDIRIPESSITAIVGKSGSGKTTLLNLLGGLDRPTSGIVRVFGKEITGMKENELSRFRSENIGFVFQFFNLLPELNGWENIVFPSAIVRRMIDEKYIKRIIDVMEINQILEKLPDKMSGGEQQRIAIARALAGMPRLLLMDEPTGNLDEDTANKIIRLITDLKNETNITIVLVTHDMDISKSADLVIRLKDGMCSNE